MSSHSPKKPDNCPICHSVFVSWFKTLPKKIGGSVELFTCLDCESFFSPFSTPYSPPDGQVAWHKSVFERNIKWAQQLIEMLKERAAMGNLVDVGCGIGSLNFAAKRMGYPGTGYDLDSFACEYGRREFKLDLRGELWSDATSPDFKLLTCISVFEHIHYPRELLREMVQAAVTRNAALYISVPFFERNWWPHLMTDNLSQGHPFEYPHAHVTHFTRKGLQKACVEFGATHVEELSVPKAWAGLLIR
jgi:2-polyprenyl-3-methyl-5-hydroxy-6-metoxy-1,4-benzoquinol methylase